MKVGFLIRTLEQTGGAEQQLACLAQSLATRGIGVQVFCFYGIGELRSSLESAGVSVHDAGKSTRWDVSFLSKLRRRIADFRPDIVHSYLETANIASVAIAPFRAKPKVVWGIRSSDMDLSRYDWTRRAVAIAELTFSHFVPDLIIANSLSGATFAAKRGMPHRRIVTVHNGVDTDKFHPNRQLAESYRKLWGAGQDTIVVGRIGRFDPMKDYRLFLESARDLAPLFPTSLFVCVGDHTSDEGRRTVSYAHTLGMQDRIRWVPPTTDVVGVLNAMDVLVSTSAFGEGFPNVLAEGMACGIPTVTTDVGDSALLVSDPSRVVPRGDKEAMVASIAGVLSQNPIKRREIGLASRSKVVQKFAQERMVESTLGLYKKLA